MIISDLSGNARAELVRLRCIGMRDGSQACIEAFRKSHSAGEAVGAVERIAFAQLEAEILHLDGADAEALRVFDTQIIPHVSGLSTDYEFIVRHNYNDVQHALWSPNATRDFYHLVDERRIARFDLIDATAILNAKNAAAVGKHYEALPDLWNELRRTYYQGCWRAFRWAAKDFSDECNQLGWPDDGCIHAILALDEPSAKKAGNHLLAMQLRDRIDRVLKWLLANANLRHHFVVASSVAAQICDAIPDDMVTAIFEWASNRISADVSTLIAMNTVREAWGVVGAIAHRLDQPQAVSAVALATGHPWWQQYHVHRKALRLTVGECVRILPEAHLAELSQEVIQHIVGHDDDDDYTDAINLVCEIARVGGDDLRGEIGEQLYKKGAKVTAGLVYVAPHFKKESALRDALEPWATHVAQCIPRQVQRLSPGEQEQQCNESYFNLTSTFPDGGKQIVHLIGTVALRATLVHRQLLSKGSLDAILTAVLDAIENRENLLANKSELIQVLFNSADMLANGRYCEKVFAVMGPLARGEIVESEHVMSAADAVNPLNRFKMGTGKPSQVRAAALCLLGKIEKASPGILGSRLEEILSQAMSSDESEVRDAAMAGWRDMPRIPPSIHMSIILNTRDQNPQIVVAAYDVIAASESFRPTVDELKVLRQSLVISSRCTSVVVRRFAARACRKLMSIRSEVTMASALQDVLKMYRGDVCYSVRRAASEADG